jgi:L-asparaginase
MQNNSKRIVVLGTGGTIAGTAAAPDDALGYRAAQLSVESLLKGLPTLDSTIVESIQVAQIDSKDMNHEVWRLLALHAFEQLARPEVTGLVITHGTDTLEETAWFLHCVLQARKPVVLTAAMRPATDLGADGPQNLVDSLLLAGQPGVQGVLAVMAGRVHGAQDVRKVHGFQVDAFSSGEAGPVALVRQGQVRQLRPWPGSAPEKLAARSAVDQALPEWNTLLRQPELAWPRVDIVVSHAGCDGAQLEALVACGSRGVVLEGTGNGTVHWRLEAAARQAMAQGVRVVRATRCQLSGVVGQAGPGEFDVAGELTPAKARVQLMLELMASSPAGEAAPLPA